MGALDKPILFITGNRLGDAVLSTGILDHFMTQHPGIAVTVACGALPAPLFDDLPGLMRVVPIVKTQRRRLGHWIQLWSAVSDQRWSDVIDLRSAVFAWTLRAERRWVCRAEKRHEHRVEELARQLGIAPAPSPKIWISATRETRLSLMIPTDRPILAIGPTANWGGKRWPAERFAEVAHRLTTGEGPLAGGRLAVFGAAHERESAQPVLAAAPDVLDLIGLDHLLDVQGWLRHAALFIGNDSGLMHMAAAAGIPTLGLFGPSAEWRYRPFGAKTGFVRTPETLAQLTSAPDYDYRSHKSLMDGLSVDVVTAAALRLLDRVNGGSDASR